MNESIYRSPKWLRNYVDFEINTGKDIKGEPSEGKKRRDNLSKWDEKFKNLLNGFDSYYFSQFVIDANKFKKEHRGDHGIWKKFEIWKNETIERLEREKKAEKLLKDIINRLLSEIDSSPFRDKMSSKYEGGKQYLIWKFENGDFIKYPYGNHYDGFSFIFDDSEFSYRLEIGISAHNRIVSLFNKLNNNLRDRPRQKYQSSNSSNSSSSSKSTKQNSNDPNFDRFNKLKDSIKLRKSQLAIMSKTDPERTGLENELSNYERLMSNMKNKYKFENLQSFIDFRI